MIGGINWSCGKHMTSSMDPQTQNLFKDPVTGMFIDVLPSLEREAEIVRITGRPMSAEQLGNLISLPGGSEAFITVIPERGIHIGGTQLEFGFAMNVTLDRDQSGAVAELQEIFRGTFPAGTGTRVFARLAESLQKHSFTRINATLFGEPGSKHNGYYTWPVLGFETEIPEDQLKALQQEGISGILNVQDLFTTYGDEGRAWWRDHGGTCVGWFDLMEGSRSWRILRNYLSRIGVRL